MSDGKNVARKSAMSTPQQEALTTELVCVRRPMPTRAWPLA